MVRIHHGPPKKNRVRGTSGVECFWPGSFLVGRSRDARTPAHHLRCKWRGPCVHAKYPRCRAPLLLKGARLQTRRLALRRFDVADGEDRGWQSLTLYLNRRHGSAEFFELAFVERDLTRA